MRIDGKCGTIIELISKGKYRTGIVRIKFDDGTHGDVGVGHLACNNRFNALPSSQMEKEIKKPFHGRRVGEHVCVSKEEPLWSD
jgi:hypothetical protein